MENKNRKCSNDPYLPHLQDFLTLISLNPFWAEQPAAITTAGLHLTCLLGRQWRNGLSFGLSCLQPAPLLAYTCLQGMQWTMGCLLDCAACSQHHCWSTLQGRQWSMGCLLDWAACSQHHCWSTLAFRAGSDQWVVFWTELPAASTTAGLHLPSGQAVNNRLSYSKFHNFHIWCLIFYTFCMYILHCSLKRYKIIWGCYSKSGGHLEKGHNFVKRQFFK